MPQFNPPMNSIATNYKPHMWIDFKFDTHSLFLNHPAESLTNLECEQRELWVAPAASGFREQGRGVSIFSKERAHEKYSKTETRSRFGDGRFGMTC